MLKAVEEVSATKKRLKIEIPAEVIEEEIRKALKEIQKKANIPGFRPGKVPFSIIERKFGKDAESDVLERLVSEYYTRAVKEANLKPLLPPLTEDVIDIKRNEPLLLDLIVEVTPEVENLNYENIEVEEIDIEVREEEIEEVLKRLSTEKGVYESTDEPASEGDLVVIDYRADTGKEARNFVYKIGAGPFPEEFSKALEGRKKGEKFTVTIDFPEGSIAEFAGKKVNFEITLNDVKKRHDIPYEELPEEMGFEDLDALQKYIRESLQRTKKQQAEQKMKLDILKKLLETHDFELPEGLLELEMKRLTAQYDSMGVDITQHMDKISETAKENVKAFILLQLIGEKEGVSVSEDELKQEIMNISRRYGISPKEVIQFYMSRDGSLDAIKNEIFEKKVFDILLEKSKKIKKEEVSQ